MPYFHIAVAGIAPILLIAFGKRLFGEQTHPAAVVILAWMLCGFLLSLTEVNTVTVSPGVVAFAWVVICFSIIFPLQNRRRSKQAPNTTGADADPPG